MYDPLFAPIRINSLDIKNRIYLPAMHLNMTTNNEVTERMIDFYAERAKGGAGMICVGFATIDELSGGPANIGAHKDEFIPGLTRLAEAIKENGSRAVVQLNHSGRYNHSYNTGGIQPVAPSAIASRLTRETPRELAVDEIEKIIVDFAKAAMRVKKAGYDAVEVLSGTGYLISEFLSPLTNQRSDDYGGSEEKRMRFGLAIMGKIKEAVGADYPLIVRINGNDFMQGGQGRNSLQNYARALAGAGVDALCVNVGWHEARVPQIVTSVPRGAFGYLARGIKEVADVPVIASHRINDPQTARTLIADGMCDMVAMGRPLIADPDMPNKARKGREQEIVHCIACAQGCFDNLFKGKAIECLCNPQAGYEKERRIEKAAETKNVLVVGGGAAGLSAALAASQRGHRVTLYDAADRLGGQLFLAAAPPGREEFEELARDLATQVELSQIKVVLNTPVDVQVIAQEKPDHVILATGAVSLTPPLEGSDGDNVVQAWDVLLDKVPTGRRVAIIGGGAVGVETALFLAEKGTLSGDTLKFLMVNKAESPEDLYDLCIHGSKEVTLIEMVDRIGKDIGLSSRWGMMQDIRRVGVNVLSGTKAHEITPTGVTIDVEGDLREIAADTVVMAAGSKPYNPLQADLEAKNITCQVVGDALGVGTAFEAVHQGFAAGRSI